MIGWSKSNSENYSKICYTTNEKGLNTYRCYSLILKYEAMFVGKTAE